MDEKEFPIVTTKRGRFWGYLRETHLSNYGWTPTEFGPDSAPVPTFAGMEIMAEGKFKTANPDAIIKKQNPIRVHIDFSDGSQVRFKALVKMIKIGPDAEVRFISTGKVCMSRRTEWKLI